jgi:uncharacterized protein with HEPN domain
LQRDDALYVGHMLDTARRVLTRIRGLTREEYDADQDLRLAVVYLIQTIGEAARKVSGELRAAHPEVPWAAIIGMRHRLVHDYIDVDEDAVWSTATEDLEPLTVQLDVVMKRLGW